jgi:hypothetical protein
MSVVGNSKIISQDNIIVMAKNISIAKYTKVIGLINY